MQHLLSNSDYVLVACPLSAQTASFLDAKRIAYMAPTGVEKVVVLIFLLKESFLQTNLLLTFRTITSYPGVIINVARGPIIDEEDLFRALSEHQIAGAVIDTWWRYPSEVIATSIFSKVITLERCTSPAGFYRSSLYLVSRFHLYISIWQSDARRCLSLTSSSSYLYHHTDPWLTTLSHPSYRPMASILNPSIPLPREKSGPANYPFTHLIIASVRPTLAAGPESSRLGGFLSARPTSILGTIISRAGQIKASLTLGLRIGCPGSSSNVSQSSRRIGISTLPSKSWIQGISWHR